MIICLSVLSFPTPAFADTTLAVEDASISADGSSLVLTFNQDLAPSPSAAGFKESAYDGEFPQYFDTAVSSAALDAVDNSKLVLTLANKIQGGFQYTLNYNAEQGSVTAAGGDRLASFSKLEVSNPLPHPDLSGGAIPDATVGSTYVYTFTAAGTTGACRYAITHGTLPEGLSLIEDTGRLSGTVADPGNYEFWITATDQIGVDTKKIILKASPACKYATELTASDSDTVGLGVDGRDFSVEWTPANDAAATGQAIYIVPSGTVLNLRNWKAVATGAMDVSSWTGLASDRTDSLGSPFAAGSFDIYVVTYSDQELQASVSVMTDAETADSELNLSWQSASGSSEAITGAIRHIVMGANQNLIAINGNKKLIQSDDGGRNWSVCDTGSFLPNTAVYDGNRFIAAGNGIMRSFDGRVWSNAMSGSSINWDTYPVYSLYSARTSMGIISIAAGGNGLILVSVPNDDLTWFKLYNPQSQVIFGNPFDYVQAHTVRGSTNISEEFVGFGSYDRGGNLYPVTAIQDQPTFTSVSSRGEYPIRNFSKAWYDENSLLFYGLEPYTEETMMLWYSDDMTHWTEAGLYSNLNSSASCPAGVTAIGSGGTIISTGDGTNWKSQQIVSSSISLNAVAHNGSIYVAVGDKGTILTSKDGWAWHLCSSGTTADLKDVTCSGSAFLISGNGVVLYNEAGLSSNAALSDLRRNGITITAFSPDKTDYTVELPYGTAAGSAAAITATAQDEEAKVVVTQAASLPGSATVTVTAEDGRTVKNYTVHLTLAPPPATDPGTDTGTNSGSGHSSSSGGGSHSATIITESAVALSGLTLAALNMKDHFGYIQGYQDGTIRPKEGMTRAEVAGILYRLLTEEARTAYRTEANSFTDVPAAKWYSNAVSTLVNAGVLTGYRDGTFRPDVYVTRAEFATILAKFTEGKPLIKEYSDIGSHWAKKDIDTAAANGWITGYDDNTFRPNQAVTRAEVMVMMNRILHRAVKASDMIPDGMKTWSDNPTGTWYYEAVQEATNPHRCQDTSEVVPGQSYNYEKWTELISNPDWSTY